MALENPKELATVNVEEGFLPKFAETFVSHYGEYSVFVRAVSDYFTIALARLLESEKVASYAPAKATESLRGLMNSLMATHDRKDVGKSLMHEAFGQTAIGSFAGIVDSTHGAGCFAKWHEA